MGVICFILGASGSGKSSSLRNMNPSTVGVFNVANKPLPFRNNWKNVISTSDYTKIINTLKAHNLKSYVIDDCNFLMCFDAFRRVGEVGYSKFTQMAVSFYALLKTIREMPEDCIVYLMGHISRDEQGRASFKTIGKMLDNQLCSVEALSSIVLMCETDGAKHWFTTVNDGNTTVKSPIDMFKEAHIPNDLAIVDKTIREFYGFEQPKVNVKKEEEK